MSELESFSTSILTNKTPEESASIVNQGVNNTKELIESNLIPFFENYTKLIQKQNFELSKLVNDQGIKITSFLNQDSTDLKQYGTFVRVWDTYLNSLNFQTQTNDQLIKYVKLEILSPLMNLVNNDIKFSEILINNQELKELAQANPIDEYQWGSKSFGIMNNFSSIKKFERQLIIKSIVGLFNFNANQHNKGVRGNEEAVKYSLNGFDIDKEMTDYLNLLMSSNPPPLPKLPPSSKPSSTAPSHSDKDFKDKKAKRQSKLFTNQKDAKDKEDRKKLRSRVGSIFGRKKKSKNGDLESIYSNQTASTNLTNLREESPQPSPVQPPVVRENGYERRVSNPNRDLPILPGTPNIENLKINDDHKETLAEPLELQEPPSIASHSAPSSGPNSRHASGVAKETYSFESGDDTNRFVTSPKINKYQELPEPNIDTPVESHFPESSTAPTPEVLEVEETPVSPTVNGEQSKSLQSPEKNAPAPPPARRAHPDRSEVKSQMFHSLPSARDSVVPQQFVPPALTTQTTGTSLINKTDMFNHSELLNKLKPGLNVSNSQIINVNFKQDNLAKASIIGELAFHYNDNDSNVEEMVVTVPPSTKTILNPVFLTKLQDNNVKVLINPINNKTLGGIKYMNQNLKLNQIPILIHSIWKFESHQASLMVNLKLNPNFGGSLVLNNLVVSVALNMSTESTSASSRPTGSFNKEKNRITWRYNNPVHLTESNSDEKLIARFMTNGVASEDDQGIQVKFSIDDVTSSGIECDYGVNVVGNLIAGNYSCQS
ncbi:suppressor of yeast profilin deletion [[Candida] jaroonii]|uniref:Suppressor of yeast profilin deletion n=1 Tax=[Candida] jaroonii TaxID=467808 RepID=A0ACA9Y6D2_9ASCO|nr:suppressor of yeast profilin deletion [[Candida] jaroonii]